jgi:hypothetical protein
LGNKKTTPETKVAAVRAFAALFFGGSFFRSKAASLTADTSGHVMSQAGKIGVHHGTVWILALFHLQNLQILKNT